MDLPPVRKYMDEVARFRRDWINAVTEFIADAGNMHMYFHIAKDELGDECVYMCSQSAFTRLLPLLKQWIYLKEPPLREMGVWTKSKYDRLYDVHEPRLKRNGDFSFLVSGSYNVPDVGPPPPWDRYDDDDDWDDHWHMRFHPVTISLLSCKELYTEFGLDASPAYHDLGRCRKKLRVQQWLEFVRFISQEHPGLLFDV
jgi:hypothetical protein